MRFTTGGDIVVAEAVIKYHIFVIVSYFSSLINSQIDIYPRTQYPNRISTPSTPKHSFNFKTDVMTATACNQIRMFLVNSISAIGKCIKLINNEIILFLLRAPTQQQQQWCTINQSTVIIIIIIIIIIFVRSSIAVCIGPYVQLPKNKHYH